MFFYFFLADFKNQCRNTKLSGDWPALFYRQRADEVLADLDGAGPGSEPEGLALKAAEARGYCRLFGSGSVEGMFPERFSQSAARQLNQIVKRYTTVTVDELPGRWDAAAEKEAQELVADLLTARMNAWAAMETLEQLRSVTGMPACLKDCEDAIDGFDLALIGRLDFLATLADTQLLANWRRALAEPYRNPYPWWLAGEIEAAAIDVERSIARMEQSLFRRMQGDIVAGSGSLAMTAEQMKSRHTLPADVPAPVGSLGPLGFWKASDERYSAHPLPPSGGREGIGPPLVVEFQTTIDRARADLLHGAVAVLGNEGVVIERRMVDGKEVTTATFSPRVSVNAFTPSGNEAAALHVMPDGGVWRMVHSEA